KVQLWSATRWEPEGPAWPLPEGGRAVALDRTGERVAVATTNQSVVICRALDGVALGKPVVWSNPTEVATAFFLENPPELLLVDAGPPVRFAWAPLEEGKPIRLGTEAVGRQPRIFLGADGRTVLTSDA